MNIENYNKFNITLEDGTEQEVEIVLSFYLKKTNRNYLLFTDNTKNENDNYVTYAYYVTEDDDELLPVTDEDELNLVNKILEVSKDTANEEDK